MPAFFLEMYMCEVFSWLSVRLGMSVDPRHTAAIFVRFPVHINDYECWVLSLIKVPDYFPSQPHFGHVCICMEGKQDGCPVLNVYNLCMFVCSFARQFICLFINSFICLFAFWFKMSAFLKDWCISHIWDMFSQNRHKVTRNTWWFSSVFFPCLKGFCHLVPSPMGDTVGYHALGMGLGDNNPSNTQKTLKKYFCRLCPGFVGAGLILLMVYCVEIVRIKKSGFYF